MSSMEQFDHAARESADGVERSATARGVPRERTRRDVACPLPEAGGVAVAAWWLAATAAPERLSAVAGAIDDRSESK